MLKEIEKILYVESIYLFMLYIHFFFITDFQSYLKPLMNVCFLILQYFLDHRFDYS